MNNVDTISAMVLFSSGIMMTTVTLGLLYLWIPAFPVQENPKYAYLPDAEVCVINTNQPVTDMNTAYIDCVEAHLNHLATKKEN